MHTLPSIFLKNLTFLRIPSFPYLCAKLENMIQRVQTLWLLAALILQTFLWFFPFASFSQEAGQNVKISLNSLPNTVENAFTGYLSLYVCWAIATLSALIAIFLFKKRKQQMKICVYGMISSLLFGGFAWITAVKLAKSTQAELNMATSLSLYLPALSLICFVLALKYIRKDEALVKSLDRIR